MNKEAITDEGWKSVLSLRQASRSQMSKKHDVLLVGSLDEKTRIILDWMSDFHARSNLRTLDLMFPGLLGDTT